MPVPFGECCPRLGNSLHRPSAAGKRLGSFASVSNLDWRGGAPEHAQPQTPPSPESLFQRYRTARQKYQNLLGSSVTSWELELT
jgi:hypothetical protein